MLSSDPAQPNLDVYGMYWLLEGLGRNGYIDEAIQVIKVYYGHMIAEGATTWWEHFDSNQSYYQSLSHSWGGSPTWFLSKYGLGLQWLSKDQWYASPGIQVLDHAAGSLPRPGQLASEKIGDAVLISWSRGLDGRIMIDLASPEGTQGSIEIPRVCVESGIQLDGVFVTQPSISKPGLNQGEEPSIRINLLGGLHQLLLNPGC